MKKFKLRAMLLVAVLLCGGNSAFADYVSQDGIDYSLGNDLTAAVIMCYHNVKTANIPEKITYNGNDYTVTRIRNAAFSGCSNLTSVNIPNSVTSIEHTTFFGCRNLASVVIPNSVTSIGSHAFFDCRSLTSVNIPSSVTSIGDDVFK